MLHKPSEELLHAVKPLKEVSAQGIQTPQLNSNVQSLSFDPAGEIVLVQQNGNEYLKWHGRTHLTKLFSRGDLCEMYVDESYLKQFVPTFKQRIKWHSKPSNLEKVQSGGKEIELIRTKIGRSSLRLVFGDRAISREELEFLYEGVGTDDATQLGSGMWVLEHPRDVVPSRLEGHSIPYTLHPQSKGVFETQGRGTLEDYLENDIQFSRIARSVAAVMGNISDKQDIEIGDKSIMFAAMAGHGAAGVGFYTSRPRFKSLADGTGLLTGVYDMQSSSEFGLNLMDTHIETQDHQSSVAHESVHLCGVTVPMHSMWLEGTADAGTKLIELREGAFWRVPIDQEPVNLCGPKEYGINYGPYVLVDGRMHGFQSDLQTRSARSLFYNWCDGKAAHYRSLMQLCSKAHARGKRPTSEELVAEADAVIPGFRERFEADPTTSKPENGAYGNCYPSIDPQTGALGAISMYAYVYEENPHFMKTFERRTTPSPGWRWNDFDLKPATITPIPVEIRVRCLRSGYYSEFPFETGKVGLWMKTVQQHMGNNCPGFLDSGCSIEARLMFDQVDRAALDRAGVIVTPDMSEWKSVGEYEAVGEFRPMRNE